MSLTIPMSLIVAHTVSDWILQTNWQALHKSKSNEALTRHVLSYSLCFLPWGLEFACFTFLTHWITDWITSRITSKFWFLPWSCDNCGVNLEYPRAYCEACGKYSGAFQIIPRYRKFFFGAIGLDQLIHFITLAVTYRLMFGN